jgi:hypothetical protein
MKTFQITILLLGITAFGFAQANDKAAIRKRLEAEILNFHTNTDRKVYISYWHIKPESRWVSSSMDGSNILLTSDEFKAGIRNNEFPPADNARCSFSNFVVKASGSIGWATFRHKDGHSRRQRRLFAYVSLFGKNRWSMENYQWFGTPV